MRACSWVRGTRSHLLISVIVLGGAALAGCSGSDDTGEAIDDSEVVASEVAGDGTAEPDVTEPPTSSPPVTEPRATEPPATEPPETTAIELDAWTSVDPGPDCKCADGSEFELWDRPADSTKVVLYLEGGGACFSADTCSFTDGTYTSSIAIGEPPAGRGGLFDQANAQNPIADHSMVYVPYCTGDVHIGDATTEYSPELTVEHNGFVNASAALDYVVTTYPDVEQLVVMGSSAGSIPTPMVAALLADELPDTEVITFGDSSGAYPDVPAVNESIGSLWGSFAVVPDWPENEGLTPAQWSIPGLYVQAGRHNPDITFARFDYAFDETQAFFGSIAGVGADELVTLIDQTAAQAETSGVNLASYVAPGTAHTIISDDAFYTMEVEGFRLIDWFTSLVDGEVPADVRCVDCAPP